MSVIKIENITKKYKDGLEDNIVLNNVSLEIEKSSIVVILGPSGSGKTTLLNILSGLETPTSGKIMYENEDITNYSESKLTKFRKENISFIFQSYNLLEHINVYENVKVGASLTKNAIDMDLIINEVGLKEKRDKYIYQLSGGEQQRVSIARALVKNPKVLFCDEPTGALDEENGKKVLERIVKINNDLKTTMVIITHNPSIAFIGDRIIRMNSGNVLSDELNTRVEPQKIIWG